VGRFVDCVRLKGCKTHRAGRLTIIFGAGLALALPSLGQAQSTDRERAQMLQMQQQLQRLQSDNAAIQRERTQLQDQTNELKKTATRRSQELAKSQGELADANREAERLRGELESLRQQSQANMEQWQKALADRDEALRVAAEDKRKREMQLSLLTTRLKVETARGDICEVKHVQALDLGRDLIDAFESERLRLCEPITGIWKVREEERIQIYRDRLHDARLDVPAPAAVSANERAAK